MKIWFIRQGKKSPGPYAIEDLKEQAVSKEDYEWKKGLTDWVQAASLPELKKLFSKAAPPPFDPQHNADSELYRREAASSPYFEPGRKPTNDRRRLVWISLMLILSLLTYLIYANKQPTYADAVDRPVQKSPEASKSELMQTEKQNPVHYISGKVSHRKNLIGETVIEGTLTSSATLAVFKDVILETNLLSKTDSLTVTKKITVYEKIAPGKTVSFKEKFLEGNEVQDVHLRIITATPADEVILK